MGRGHHRTTTGNPLCNEVPAQRHQTTVHLGRPGVVVSPTGKPVISTQSTGCKSDASGGHRDRESRSQPFTRRRWWRLQGRPWGADHHALRAATTGTIWGAGRTTSEYDTEQTIGGEPVPYVDFGFVGSEGAHRYGHWPHRRHRPVARPHVRLGGQGRASPCPNAGRRWVPASAGPIVAPWVAPVGTWVTTTRWSTSARGGARWQVQHRQRARRHLPAEPCGTAPQEGPSSTRFNVTRHQWTDGGISGQSRWSVGFTEVHRIGVHRPQTRTVSGTRARLAVPQFPGGAQGARTTR